MIRQIIIGMLLAAALTACAVEDDIILPAGHPADPSARAAKSITISTALEPELQAAKPQVGEGAQKKPSNPTPDSGADRHRHH